MKVVLLDGSPAMPSRVGLLLATIAERLTAEGHNSKVLDLQAMQLPLNDPAYHLTPHEHPNKTVRSLVSDVTTADVVVLGTPLYHGSYSGLIKMALDHLGDAAFRGKAVGLVGNATGPRNAVLSATVLLPVARALKGQVLNCTIGTCQTDYGLKDGTFQITEQDILDRIDRFVREATQATA